MSVFQNLHHIAHSSRLTKLELQRTYLCTILHKKNTQILIYKWSLLLNKKYIMINACHITICYILQLMHMWWMCTRNKSHYVHACHIRKMYILFLMNAKWQVCQTVYACHIRKMYILFLMNVKWQVCTSYHMSNDIKQLTRVSYTKCHNLNIYKHTTTTLGENI